VIDLHSHILSGLDDGPDDIEGSLEMGRVAAACGTETIAATPHIRDDHPFDLGAVEPRTDELNAAFDGAGIGLRVVPAGEVAISKALELGRETLRSLCLGDGPYLLVESPYTPVTDLFEANLFDLQVRGFRPLLAHPERSPSFLEDAARITRLVERGLLCSITAASLSGQFGRTVRRFALAMLKEGLVHNVASDAHDPTIRAPDLSIAIDVIDKELPGGEAHGRWLTQEAPAAVLAGETLPSRPQSPSGPRSRWFRSRTRRKKPSPSED
jgi:protein-tyrosine phosphatase